MLAGSVTGAINMDMSAIIRLAFDLSDRKLHTYQSAHTLGACYRKHSAYACCSVMDAY